MVKQLSKNHYLATPDDALYNSNHEPVKHPVINSEWHDRIFNHRGYSTDGEDNRALSDRTMSEYMITNERTTTSSLNPPRNTFPNKDVKNQKRSHRSHSAENYNSTKYYDDNSDMYVTTPSSRPPSETSRGSRYSHRSRAASNYSYHSGPTFAPSEVSTIKSKVSRRPGVTIETMAAPNPFCPNTKGICCLMLLLNLGLILVMLGFVIVLQFFEPIFVWILGAVFLVFGFVTLMGSLIYCVYICRDVKSWKEVAMQDHYWTHHWQKSFGATPEKYPASEHDRFSDRYSDHQRNRY